MKDHFPEKVSPQVQKQFEEMFAMWTYQKGLSFCLWDESFQKIISFLRPGVRLPSTDRLRGSLLTKSYVKTEDALSHFLATGVIKLTLGFDSWTDVNQNSIINFVALSSEACYLVSSIDTGVIPHSAENLANYAEQIIRRYPESYVGAITDNTSTNKAMWNLLNQRFPDKFFYGCAAHVWHLLVKDLFVIPSSWENNAENYPLKSFVDLQEICTEIVKTFKRGRLKQELKDHQIQNLLRVFETCWRN